MDTKTKPWNKNKSVGQKKPFSVDQVETIRRILETKKNLRDIALFNVAIDSMLRSVDLLALTVGDVVDHDGNVVVEFNVKQRKTLKGVRVFLSDHARESIEKWIKKSKKIRNDFLFSGTRRSKDKAITREAYRKLVKRWIADAYLDPSLYSTHSLRRTKAAFIYSKTQNVEAIRILLGQSSVSATSHYLGLEQSDALDIAKNFKM